MKRLTLVVFTIMIFSSNPFLESYEHLDANVDSRSIYPSNPDFSNWTLSPSSGTYHGGTDIQLNDSTNPDLFDVITPRFYAESKINNLTYTGVYKHAVSLDSDGILHGLYTSSLGTENNLTYLKYDGNNWNFSVIITNVEQASLALDSTGNIHVLFTTRTGLDNDYNNRSVKYAHSNDGMNWNISDIANGISPYGPVIKVDNSGKLHTAYWSSSSIRHDTSTDGVNWSYGGTVSSMNTLRFDFELDSNGNPFFLVSNNGLKLVTHDGNSWFEEQVLSTTPITLGSLAIDDSGYAHVVYCDSELYFNYTSNLEGYWSGSVIDTKCDGAGNNQHNSIEIDVSGVIHVSYGHNDGYESNGGSGDALNHATFVKENWIINTIISNSSSNPPAIHDFPMVVDDSCDVHFIVSIPGGPEEFRYIKSKSETTDEYGCDNKIEFKSLLEGNGESLILTDNTHPDSSLGSIAASTTAYVDDDKNLHLTYAGFEGMLNYSIFDGESWITNTVDVNSSLLHSACLGVDSAGNIHIAYASGVSLNFRYATSSDGINWEITNLVAAYRTGESCSLVVDSIDNVHIAYSQNAGQPTEFMYAKRTLSGDNNANWSQYTIDMDTGKDGQISLQVDSSNNPHVVYFGNTNGDGSEKALRYASSTDGYNWTSTIVDSYSGQGAYVGKYNSLVIDSDDNLHVSYSQYNTAPGYPQGILYANKMVGQSWTTTLLYPGERMGSMNHIDTDSSGNIYIISQMRNETSCIGDSLSIYDGQSWSHDSISSICSDYSYVSFSIDSSDHLHMTGMGPNDVLQYRYNSPMYRVTIGFGDYGNVTGTVVNDALIEFTSPPGPFNGDTVNLTLINWKGITIELPFNFTYLDGDLDDDGVANLVDLCPNTLEGDAVDSDGCSEVQKDSDLDGIHNEIDDCPNTGGNSSIESLGCPDADGDGYWDFDDAFPEDSNEWEDSDGDDVGDNSDEFPSNPSEWIDSDGDSIGDNSDAFPNNSSEWNDSDLDGVGDNSDALPNDPSETVDSDGDGIGDNSDAYPYLNNFLDSDGDTVPDFMDDFPSDMTQWRDSDGDGWGDNPNGVNPDQCPFVSGVELGAMPDGSPGIGCPPPVLDEDGDGIEDGNDECPRTDELLNVDTNGCAINQKDTDDDGVNDSIDKCPSTIYLGFVDEEGCLLDEDDDGIFDLNDRCLETIPGSEIDENGCEITIESTKDDDVSFTSRITDGGTESILSLIVIFVLVLTFSISQTNYGAAKLPKSFQWIQVIKSKKLVGNKIKKTSPVIETKGNEHPDKDLKGEINPTDNYEYLEFPSETGAWYIRDVDTQEWKKWE
ncbi:thrombospondin type 3 repeat-containing protein [Candidatus Poseidoniaceae archaeon]|nr:thrombospondin type 3 repeat-containing protein [Candidatus Poseidoniaceae archaeon]